MEPWEQNKNDSWPEPQLQSISEGNISLVNSTNDSIILGKDVKKIKVRGTTEVKPPDIDQTFYKYKPDLKKINGEGDDNIKLIVQSNKITEEAKEIIEKAHSQFQQVFNKDLSEGYNSYYGKHECHLN